MTSDYDFIIRNGRLVDPAANIDGISDVGIVGGRVTATGQSLPGRAAAEIDASGKLIVPGLVDLHVHLSEHNAGAVGHGMLARAGVTTALDLTGPTDETVRLAASHGAGLTIGVLEAIRPEAHLPANPTKPQIRAAIADILRRGAIGVKLHVDSGWDADSTAAIIEEATTAGVWVASHCGTTSSASTVDGLEETLALADGNPIQIAHVNSYCRGELGDPLEEATRAVELLRAAPNAFGESYLDRFNATWGECSAGVPKNHRLIGWLSGAGFSPDEHGIIRAISQGWAGVVVADDSGATLADGERGVAAYRESGGQIAICLPVNPAASRIALATSRRPAGDPLDAGFDIAAFATDGGGLPRNTTLAAGLALVELGALTHSELITKAALTPARLLGLADKGHLQPGADADLAVVDPLTRQVETLIAGGRLTHHNGRTRRAAATLLTSSAARLPDWPGRRIDLNIATSGLVARTKPATA